jgi:hypothetical protein
MNPPTEQQKSMATPPFGRNPPLHPVNAPASPWPTFWIASIAVFLVSIDSTVLLSDR